MIKITNYKTYIQQEQEKKLASLIQKPEMSIYDFSTEKTYNKSNSMAAAMHHEITGMRKSRIKESMQSEKSFAHTMELVATIKGINFINNSKATNVNSTWYALENMTAPTVLILGGIDKGNDYSILYELVKSKVKAIVCLGKENTALFQAFKSRVGAIVDTDNMVDAVKTAYQLAVKTDAVLLSPACPSFDLFKNYEDRGNQFKKAVKEL